MFVILSDVLDRTVRDEAKNPRSCCYNELRRSFVACRFEGNDRFHAFPSQYACVNGSPSLTLAGCSGNGGVWYPDLRRSENLIDMDILAKF